MLYVEDWDGIFKRAYKVINGQVTSDKVERVDKSGTSATEKGARKRDVCAETIVAVYTVVEVACPSSVGGGDPNGGNSGPCYDLQQTGSFVFRVCGGGSTGGGDGGDGTVGSGDGSGGSSGPDVPPASVSDDYEYNMTTSAILSLYEDLTDDPVQFYLIAKQRNNSILNLSLYSTATNQFQIGPYNLMPHYDKSRQLLFYAAYRSDRNVGIEYVIRADAIGKFRYNIDYYVRAANLFYLNGIPSDGQLQYMAGNYFQGLQKMWGEALSSPEYWAFAIAAFGEVVGLKPPKIADTVPKTILSDASLGRMVNLLKEASVKQGYYTFGTANAVEADIMGAAWVGPNFSVSQSSQGATIWISEDRLRQYRSPVRKNSNITQANFEKRDMPSGGWPHNGHLDVTP